MSGTVPGFIGIRLLEARRARGISATDLAGMIGVTSQSISRYENGKQLPRWGVYRQIASTLNMPTGFFLREGREKDEAPIFWRGHLTAPASKKDRAEVRLGWVKDAAEFVSQYFDFPELNLPVFDIPDIDSITDDLLQKVAIETRSHWGIDEGPMPNVLRTMERNGVIVSRISMGADKLDAFSQWSDSCGSPIVVLGRDKSSAVRQRFDALHELSHLILHKSVKQVRLNDRASYKRIENQADRLASHLLLPEREFAEELFAPTLDGLLMLKERWGASVGAMIMKCRSLDVLSEGEARTTWINYNRRGWRKNEPLDSTLTKERPFLLRKCFGKLIESNLQSVDQIREALPFPAADLEEITDVDRGTFSDKLGQEDEPQLKDSFRSDKIVNLF